MTKQLNPTVLGMRASMLLFLYRRRLRAHPLQELLAAVGIAVGVALVFGVLVANSSLTSSAGELVRGLDGSARLALVARSPAGFPEQLTDRVRALPGVQAATPVLRQSATVAGPHGRERLQLIGVSGSLASLGGIATQQMEAGQPLLSSGIVLPSGIAQHIGARSRGSIALMAGGYARRVGVRVVSPAAAGFKMLADSPVAVATLSAAQRMLGRPDAASEILVEPAPGQDAAVAARLRSLAGGRLDVTAADNELRLLSQATQPNRQSTSLFSAISVMVGFLLALNAMLLTVPERRRFIAELRMQGYAPRQVLLMLVCEALLLGLAASLLGVGLGAVLSHTLFQQVPAYLSAAFPLGSRQVIKAGVVALAVGFGLLATLLASLSPALDLRPGLAPDAVLRDSATGGGETLHTRTIIACGAAGLLLAGFVGGLAALVPSLTIVGGVTLALCTLCFIPLVLGAIAWLLPQATQHLRSGAMVVATSELRALTARSVALAGIAGLAVYGCVAIGGSRTDLLRGIDRAIVQYHSTAAVWVTAGEDVFNTDSFPVGRLKAQIAALGEVRSVRVYEGGLSDVGSRRIWVRARPQGDGAMIEPSQVLRGDPALAQRLLRSGMWVALSSGLADEYRLHVGGRFMLPTPSGPRAVRVAAITTNSGWPSGTITMSASDYGRWWNATGDAAALEVDLRAGMAPAAAAHTIQGLLASRPGLVAQSATQRTLEAQANARQGLRTLGQISTLLLIAAALAVASALSAAVWQRRARLAALKIQGYDPQQLWRGLLLESAVMLGTGSTLGALVGMYGHSLASRWLTLTTGFPAPFAVGTAQVFLTLGLVSAIALAVIALPGMAAARVPARFSLQE